jgi:ferredoxin-NADP reductase
MSTAVADWPKFVTKLRDRREVAERTMAFRFDKPATFKFTPGQFLDITLLNPHETFRRQCARVLHRKCTL